MAIGKKWVVAFKFQKLFDDTCFRGYYRQFNIMNNHRTSFCYHLDNKSSAGYYLARGSLRYPLAWTLFEEHPAYLVDRILFPGSCVVSKPVEVLADIHYGELAEESEVGPHLDVYRYRGKLEDYHARLRSWKSINN